MALAVAQATGTTSTGTGTSMNLSFTSSTTSGSLVIVVACVFQISSTMIASEFTDNKSNTFQLAGALGTGVTECVGMGYNNNGTRGASHQCTINPNGASHSMQIGIIEVTGQDVTNSTSCFDSTTMATANDTTSAFTVTAAAAISGNQIGVYGCSIGGASGNQAVGNPTGYTPAGSQGNANTDLCYYVGYKLNETGTPAPGCTWTGTVGSESPREIFASFKEAAGGTPDTPWMRYRQNPRQVITPQVMRRRH